MTFLNGLLELMSPSPTHEFWKANIARLVEGIVSLREYEAAVRAPERSR